MHLALFCIAKKEWFRGTKRINFDHRYVECDQKRFNGKNFRRIAYVNSTFTSKMLFDKNAFIKGNFMEKFKYINYSLVFAIVVLGGCATKPSPLEEQMQQKEELRKQQDAEIQQKIEELTATLDEQSEKLKAMETLVEAKPLVDRRSQDKQDEAASELEGQKAVQSTISKVPAWFLNTESSPDFIYANATENSADLQLSIDMAMLSGKRQLVQILGEMVSSRMTDFAAQSGSTQDGAVNKEVERVTKSVVADVQLGGYQREKIEVVPNGKTFRAYVRLSYSTADLKRIMTKEMQKTEVLNTKIRRTKAFEELEKEIELSRELKTKNRSRQDAD